MAASAESFDNCQSSSSIRSFRTLPHFAQPERICGGPGANSFSPVSFRGKLFFSVIKNTCAVCFSGALSLNMIRFRLTGPFLSGHPPAPCGISPHLFRTIQAVICCHSFAIPSSGIPSPHNKAFRTRCLSILHRRRSQFKHQLLKERKNLVFKQ